jgi:hypothetical protein
MVRPATDDLRFYVHDHLLEICHVDCASHGPEPGFTVALVIDADQEIVLGPNGPCFCNFRDGRIVVLKDDDPVMKDF